MRVITLARKPLQGGSIAENVLRHGTGGLNIDGCRIDIVDGDGGNFRTAKGQSNGGNWGSQGSVLKPCISERNPKGRWPANVILEHKPDCRCMGKKKVRANQSSAVGSGRGHANTEGHGIYHGVGGVVRPSTADTEGLEEVPVWECHPDCPVKALDDQSGFLHSGARPNIEGKIYSTNRVVYGNDVKAFRSLHTDEGGASRFFKQVKR